MPFLQCCDVFRSLTAIDGQVGDGLPQVLGDVGSEWRQLSGSPSLQPITGDVQPANRGNEQKHQLYGIYSRVHVELTKYR